MHHIEIVSQLEGAHLEQLPELLGAATVADSHEPIGEHKFLRLQRGSDLGVAVLAYEDSALAGYAHTVTFDDTSDRRVSCEFVVHPRYRRRGVGRMLLSHALLHAETQDAARMDLWAYNHSVASERIATRFGFTPSRRLYHLHRHAGHARPPDQIPGTTLRTFRPGEDDAPWLALNNRIFRGHPENGAWTLDDLHARMAQPWFNPGDVLILESGGGPAGFCWVKIEDRGDDGRVGEIYVIGVAPEHRGHGYARTLLAHAIAHMATRAADTAAIYVDATNTNALALYDSAGFHRHHVDVCYSRDLSASNHLARPTGDAAAA